MRTTTPTPTQRLADVLLAEEGPLSSFVAKRRAQKPKRSWRLIARDLFEITEGQIDLTGETLRGWFAGEMDGQA